MDKCRLCLGNRKNLMSIYDHDKSTIYVDMITSLSNIKIKKDDGVTDKICRSCRKTLRDAYDFKCLIERSDAALYEKKINFSNINDIKIKIEIELESKPILDESGNVQEYFTGGVNEICYNNTTIKKLESHIKEPIPVLQFLKSIDNESIGEAFSNIYDTDDDDGSACDKTDDEFIPPRKLLNIRFSKYKKSKKYNRVDNKFKHLRKRKPDKKLITGVCIKPIYLNHLKVLPQISKNPKVSNKNKPSIREEMCPYCGQMKKCMKIHLLQHTGERKYKCDQCGKNFFTENHLNYHLRKHSAIKNFKCDQCVASFINWTALRGHMLTHSSEKNHVCEICNKAFKRRAAWNRHRRSHNLANKNIKCDLCNMSFFSGTALRHHMRVHTGERPFKCELCNQPYSYKHDFNRHCFKKHGVFLKRRAVKVMNEEVLKHEQAIMRDLLLRIRGIVQDGAPTNPFEFEGSTGALAFEQAIRELESRKIPIPIEFQL